MWFARAFAAALFAALVLLLPRWALAAWEPPPFDNYVVDPAHKLSDGDKRHLIDKLAAYERGSGNQVAVLVLGAVPEGETIEDIRYNTFRAWKLGKAGKDNGVLLVVTTEGPPGKRPVQIETGKGVGGDLTNLQSHTIVRERMVPLLKQDRLRDGIEAGIDGIMAALGGQSAADERIRRPQPARRSSCMSAIPISIILLFVIFAIWRSRGGGGGGGGGGFFFFPGGGFGGGGGDWGGGDGGGFGGGGGGESGGGGGGDSY